MRILIKLILPISFLLLTTCASSVVNKNAANVVISNENLLLKQPQDIETDALKKLYEAVSKNSKNAELKNNQIIVGDKVVRLSVQTEHDLANQGKYIFAARFETKLMNAEEQIFTIGSIGIGEDRKDAVETSIDEWIGLFATAFSEMLANKNSLKIDDYQVYAGLMGIRGEKPANG